MPLFAAAMTGWQFWRAALLKSSISCPEPALSMHESDRTFRTMRDGFKSSKTDVTLSLRAAREGPMSIDRERSRTGTP